MTYAGDLSPTEAHALLTERENAVLVDCRTQAEWTFVGVPAMEGTRFVEWTRYPDGSRNEQFVNDVAGGLSPDQPIVVLCRTGGRSAAGATALTEAGFTEVYNCSTASRDIPTPTVIARAAGVAPAFRGNSSSG